MTINISLIKDVFSALFIMIVPFIPHAKPWHFRATSLVIYQLRRETTVTLSQPIKLPISVHLPEATMLLTKFWFNSMRDEVTNRRHCRINFPTLDVQLKRSFDSTWYRVVPKDCFSFYFMTIRAWLSTDCRVDRDLIKTRNKPDNGITIIVKISQ